MPKERLVGWIDSMLIPNGAPNRDHAIKFIEFISEPANATEQIHFDAHASPMDLVADDVVYTPEKAPALYRDVPVEFSRTCSPVAQEVVM